MGIARYTLSIKHKNRLYVFIINHRKSIKMRLNDATYFENLLFYSVNSKLCTSNTQHIVLL